MEFKPNNTLEKIVKSKQVPVSLNGYILLDPKGDPDFLCLYPKLDYHSFFRLKKSCIIEVYNLDDKGEGYVTVLVDGSCELECTNIKKAIEIGDSKKGSCCGEKGVIEDDVQMKKADLRRFVLSFARILKAAGIDQVDCDKVARESTVSVACCRAWKELASNLDTVSETGSAQQVEAFCFGIG